MCTGALPVPAGSVHGRVLPIPVGSVPGRVLPTQAGSVHGRMLPIPVGSVEWEGREGACIQHPGTALPEPVRKRDAVLTSVNRFTTDHRVLCNPQAFSTSVLQW